MAVGDINDHSGDTHVDERIGTSELILVDADRGRNLRTTIGDNLG